MKLPAIALETIYTGDICTYDPENGHLKRCTVEDYRGFFRNNNEVTVALTRKELEKIFTQAGAINDTELILNRLFRE